MVKLVMVGEGAYGLQHLRGLAHIPEVEVVSLVGGVIEPARAAAAEFRIPHVTLDLDEALALPGVDGAILATPTQLHASQAIRCLAAGKHVQVEIPMADNLADAERLADAAQRSGLVAMAGHTRRFNPSHRWINARARAGALTIHQMDVQTYFMRRTNINALGQPRSWTDNLLWHHACHTVDLFQHQTGELANVARAIQGPPHPQLGIAMDMSVQMKTPSGAVCTLSLSFNNQGPIGSIVRYICDEATYIARYDDLVDGDGKPIALPGETGVSGIELQDREFVRAIREDREPAASVAQVLPAYRTLDALEKSLA